MTRYPQHARRRLPWPLLVACLLAACLLAGCAKDIPVFTPPAQRPLAAAGQPWPDNNHLVVLAYHDVEDKDPDQAYLNVHTDHLIGQLAWLRENGYQAVSVLQQAKVAVIDHEHDGGIAGVRLGYEWQLRPVKPAVAASAEACPA
ncbi:hypothetical protein [Cupriavidus consociatus]|uniref:hypothetical protein n=1 Tax=Cupriavidus consociatus TaxID=2821357 RepID=UPI003015476A